MKKSLNSSRSRFFLFVTHFLAIIHASHVTANEQINLAHKAVIDAVEQFVYNQLSPTDDSSIQISAMPLDPRIVVPQCPVPLQVSASEEALQQTNITVRASCEQKDWYLYLIVKATRIQQVVVLSRSVGPGTILTSQNVELKALDKNLIRTSTFANIDTVLGARMKKRSRAGQPIVPGQLCFVCKGDSILITANVQGLEIKTTGIAQQDGNLGDTIEVENTRTKKTVHGQVVNTRQVVVQI